MKRFGIGLLLLALVAWASPALSQTAAFPAPVYGIWQMTGRVSGGLNAGITSTRVAFTTTGPTAWICNTGSVTAYLAVGSVTVVATVAGSFPLYAIGAGPGPSCVAWNLHPNQATQYTHLAAITNSSTAQLDVMTGIGSPGTSGKRRITPPPAGCTGAADFSDGCAIAMFGH